MMEELKTSGLPIYCNAQGKLEFDDSLVVQGRGEKKAGEMLPLLWRQLPEDEPYYDVYRGIMRPEDARIYEDAKKRYDITVIMANAANGECKKTSGHFHAYLPGASISYPEVYEVLLGTAMFILVKAEDHTVPPDRLVVEDIRLVTVSAGETLLVPPNYGHASVNAGDGPMVFSNICTLKNKSDYSIVKHFHGMPYYIVSENNKIVPLKNENWTMPVPEPRMMRVKENAGLGIRHGSPVYGEFIRNPDTFRYLDEPAGYAADIMEMLVNG